MSQYLLHYDRAREFFDEGNYDGAKAAAEYALQKAGPSEGAEAKLLLAMTMRKLEFNDEAIQMFYELVCSSPTAEACAEYALMCAERGRCDAECRELATRAVSEAPDLSSAYMALFWCDSTDGNYSEALKNLRLGLHRGAEFSESRAFEMIRGWCQEACDQNDPARALALSGEVVELFNTLDFLIMHARLAEIAGEERTAVAYYKRTLNMLRPGGLRTDVLEAIARIAI